MQNFPPRYGWRLASLMAERKIRTAVELHRRLAEVGHKITPSQVTRIIYDRPQQVKTALLDALGRVFGCTMDEIMPVVDSLTVENGQGETAFPVHGERRRSSEADVPTLGRSHLDRLDNARKAYLEALEACDRAVLRGDDGALDALQRDAANPLAVLEQLAKQDLPRAAKSMRGAKQTPHP